MSVLIQLTVGQLHDHGRHVPPNAPCLTSSDQGHALFLEEGFGHDWDVYGVLPVCDGAGSDASRGLHGDVNGGLHVSARRETSGRRISEPGTHRKSTSTACAGYAHAEHSTAVDGQVHSRSVCWTKQQGHWIQNFSQKKISPENAG